MVVPEYISKSQHSTVCVFFKPSLTYLPPPTPYSCVAPLPLPLPAKTLYISAARAACAQHTHARHAHVVLHPRTCIHVCIPCNATCIYALRSALPLPHPPPLPVCMCVGIILVRWVWRARLPASCRAVVAHTQPAPAARAPLILYRAMVNIQTVLTTAVI